MGKWIVSELLDYPVSEYYGHVDWPRTKRSALDHFRKVEATSEAETRRHASPHNERNELKKGIKLQIQQIVSETRNP